MNETPRANRIRIAFFGLRNAGKSTLVNAFTGQDLAIVSETPGTTTDPVSKAMEILPLGPCLVTDTAGLDDVGELGAQRVAKTLAVLATTDVAVWVRGEEEKKVGRESRSTAELAFGEFKEECRKRNVTVLEYRRGDSVAALRGQIASLRLNDEMPGLLDGLVTRGDRVICVCPIDASAPKGRLILPQVQVIRAALDLHATCEVCQVAELPGVLGIADHGLQIADGSAGAPGRLAHAQMKGGKTLVVTDSQAFGEVKKILSTSCLTSRASCPCEDMRRETRDASERIVTRDLGLTSFSILFARQKGDLGAFLQGLEALRSLNDGDTVLVAEGCTHHRQCNDIGTVKIPKAVEKLSGRKLNFVFASGGDFIAERTADGSRETGEAPGQETRDKSNNQAIKQSQISLVVQCGGCMLTRREMLRRIDLARAAGIPIVNYGMVLAAAGGIDVDSVVFCFASPGSCLSSAVSRPGQGEGGRRETRDATGGDGRRETGKI